MNPAPNPASEVVRGRKGIDVLRWLGVLPAAMLADFVVHLIAGLVSSGIPGDSSAYFLKVFLDYVPRKAAFVIAGAKMAPRNEGATSVVLTVVGILVSLMTHIVGQHLAGNRVGFTNYTHFIAESFGLVAGAAYILWQAWRNRRRDLPTLLS